MNLRLLVSPLAVLIILTAGATECVAFGRADRQSKTDLIRKVDRIFAEWTAPGSPGAAVVLTDRGKVVLERCYGLADVEHGVPIQPSTRFELASVSKPFTAFGILLLEQAGRLNLADDVHKYLPELPDYGSPVTIADLVYQTSGISDYVRVLAYTAQYGRTGFGTDDLVGLAARQRVLEFAPGTKWAYSNTNYALLAEIVARVTGQPFGEWMRSNVFEPLDMRDTSFPANGTAVLPNRANAYSRKEGGALARSLVENFEVSGCAHAFSTIEDMARWADNFRTGKVGGLAVIEKMRKTPTLAGGGKSSYAAGLGIGRYRGVTTLGHSGQTGSFKTEFVYCPEVGVGAVVLANAGWLDASELSRRVLDIYLERKLEPLPNAAAQTLASTASKAPSAAASTAAAGGAKEEAFALDPAEYRRFLGGYRLEADPSVLVAVSREGEWLVGAMVGEGADLFRPVGPARFENLNENCTLAFEGGERESSAAERVLITLRGEEMWANRVPVPPDAPWIEECAGFYYSDELESAYEIVREAEGLAIRIRTSETRPLQPADTDILACGLGILTVLRNEDGRVVGFDLGEPENFRARQIRFARCERSL